jgi:NADPH-dependent 2,4-dienoyl-CoA reductase/sulfur reductase-like enzyme
VHLLRTLDDALALRNGIRGARSVAIIGGGFMGSEIAAVARELDRAVTLIDLLPAPMISQLGEEVAGRVAGLHTRHGVQLRCGVGVTRLTGTNSGRVTGVDLSDGTHVDADLVVVAIGAAPTTGWLEDSGLQLGNGIECDSRCQAAPGVVAAGDVAAWDHPDLGQRRVEHRMNATTHAIAAAGTLLGDTDPYDPVSYFWTDQYDVKIQAYGHTSQAMDFEIVAENPDTGAFAALYGTDGQVTGALAWNMPRQARMLRQHVVNRSPFQPAIRETHLV